MERMKIKIRALPLDLFFRWYICKLYHKHIAPAPFHFSPVLPEQKSHKLTSSIARVWTENDIWHNENIIWRMK